MLMMKRPKRPAAKSGVREYKSSRSTVDVLRSFGRLHSRRSRPPADQYVQMWCGRDCPQLNRLRGRRLRHPRRGLRNLDYRTLDLGLQTQSLAHPPSADRLQPFRSPSPRTDLHPNPATHAPVCRVGRTCDEASGGARPHMVVPVAYFRAGYFDCLTVTGCSERHRMFSSCSLRRSSVRSLRPMRGFAYRLGLPDQRHLERPQRGSAVGHAGQRRWSIVDERHRPCS